MLRDKFGRMVIVSVSCGYLVLCIGLLMHNFTKDRLMSAMIVYGIFLLHLLIIEIIVSIASYSLTYKWIKKLIGPHLKEAIPPKEIIDFHHHPILLNQHLYKRTRDTLYNIIRETDSFNDCRFGCYIVGGYHSLHHTTKTYWLAMFDEKDKNLFNPIYITMNGEVLSRFQLKYFKYNPVIYINTYTHTHNRKLDKKIVDSYDYALSIGIDEVWEEI